jgi:hypothetical protein
VSPALRKHATLQSGFSSAPPGTKIKPADGVSNVSCHEDLVNDLLEPLARARRKRAIGETLKRNIE